MKIKGRGEWISEVSLEGDGVCIRLDNADWASAWAEIILTRKDLLDMLEDSGYKFPKED